MDGRTRYLLVATHLLVLLLGFTLAQSGPATAQDLPNDTREASARIAAVSASGSGTIGQVTATIEPGTGKVLLDTNPFVETDTQFSAKTAKAVAEDVTNVDLSDHNGIYTFSIEGDYIGGPSAGAAMTVATIAAIRDKKVRKDAAITGTVRPDGRIGRVGSVMEKAMVAGRAGLKTFLVPPGQESTFFYEPVVTERAVGGFVFRDVQYEPTHVSLDNLTTSRYDMRTRPTATIEAATQTLLR